MDSHEVHLGDLFFAVLDGVVCVLVDHYGCDGEKNWWITYSFEDNHIYYSSALSFTQTKYWIKINEESLA